MAEGLEAPDELARPTAGDPAGRVVKKPAPPPRPVRPARRRPPSPVTDAEAAAALTFPEPAPVRGTGTLAYELLWRSGLLNLLTIARRELAVYLVSPIGYVSTAVLIIPISLFAYVRPLLDSTPIEMARIYQLVLYLMVFFAPLNTMRLIAEERRSGTLEILLTSPTRDWEVVLGKWLGAFGYYVLSTAFVLVYVLLLAHYSQAQTSVTIIGQRLQVPNLEYGAIFTGYVGMLLVGGTFVAVGVLASSLAQNQVVAAVIAIGLLVLLIYVLGYLSGFLVQPYSDFLDYLSAYNRYQSFMQGQLVLRDAVYFVSLTLVVLFLTVRVLESRKWR